MRLLLIAPHDAPDTSPRWTAARWDDAVDLGRATTPAYHRWSQLLACPVQGVLAFSRGIAELQSLRAELARLSGALTDSLGLDWAELLAVRHNSEWLELAMLQHMAEAFASAQEVTLSRSCRLEPALRLLFGDRLHVLSREAIPASQGSALQRGWRALRHLTRAQVADVLCDKYDPQFRLRARLAPARRASAASVVLVPTAYVNVTRSAASYARLLPQARFLFVHTRPSAAEAQPAPNLRRASLAAYVAPRPGRAAEQMDLVQRLGQMLGRMEDLPFFRFAARAGWCAAWPQELATGLVARDAWRTVLDREPVAAVLCGDDTNPFTRLPLPLAAQRGLPTVSYHHGALDGIAALKQPYAAIHLAKGPMERDYLTRVCGMSEEHVAIGAATGAASAPARESRERDAILFFSESYEALGARPIEVYRDLLPPLLALARAQGKRLLIKLHPFESERGRIRLLRELGFAPGTVEFVTGPMTAALLGRAWCGLTVESSAAIDCALAGVPCFLCEWAFTFDWGYPQQYVRFGGGTLLHSPAEIADIPALLAQSRPDPAFAAQLAQTAKPEELMQLLGLEL